MSITIYLRELYIRLFMRYLVTLYGEITLMYCYQRKNQSKFQSYSIKISRIRQFQNVTLLYLTMRNVKFQIR